MNRSFTIGTDPEFFILGRDTQKGKKAADFTPGTKDDVEDLKNGYAVHADNVMLELNIPPATSKKGFINNILVGKSKLQDIIGDDFLSVVPSMTFEKEDLKEDHDWEIGCDPDLSAYTKNENPKIEFKDGVRYAGGHVHVGLPPELSEDMDVVVDMVKAMDYLFLDMVVREDNNQSRKDIYGTPGRFRFKDYGFEYRSLSNFWLKDIVKMGRVYDIVQEVVNNYKKYLGEKYEKIVFDSFQTTQVKEETTIQEVQEINA